MNDKSISDEIRIEFYHVATLELLILTKNEKKKTFFLFFFDKTYRKQHTCVEFHHAIMKIDRYLKIKLVKLKF